MLQTVQFFYSCVDKYEFIPYFSTDVQRIKVWMYTRVCAHVHSPWHSKSGKIRIYLDWFVRKFEIYIYKRYVIGHLPGFNNVWRPEVVHRSFVRHLYGFLTQKLSIFPGNINLSKNKTYKYCISTNTWLNVCIRNQLNIFFQQLYFYYSI